MRITPDLGTCARWYHQMRYTEGGTGRYGKQEVDAARPSAYFAGETTGAEPRAAEPARLTEW